MQRLTDFYTEGHQNLVSLRVLLGVLSCFPLKDVSHQPVSKSKQGAAAVLAPGKQLPGRTPPSWVGPGSTGLQCSTACRKQSPQVGWWGLKADSLMLETTVIIPTRDGVPTAGPRLCISPDAVPACCGTAALQLSWHKHTNQPKWLCLQRPAFLPRTFRSSHTLPWAQANITQLTQHWVKPPGQIAGRQSSRDLQAVPMHSMLHKGFLSCLRAPHVPKLCTWKMMTPKPALTRLEKQRVFLYRRSQPHKLRALHFPFQLSSLIHWHSGILQSVPGEPHSPLPASYQPASCLHQLCSAGQRACQHPHRWIRHQRSVHTFRLVCSEQATSPL